MPGVAALSHPESELDSLLTSAQLAEWLQTSQRTVCLWAELGEIPGFKVGHQWRFRKAEILIWYQKSKRPSAPEPKPPPVPPTLR